MKVWKILFWIFTIALGFVNPLISFGLLVLYYSPELIRSICSNVTASVVDDTSTTKNIGHDKLINSKIKFYSEDILEKMK